MWHKQTGKLVNMLKADDSVVNGVAPHPHLPYLATCGIDSDGKVSVSPVLGFAAHQMPTCECSLCLSAQWRPLCEQVWEPGSEYTFNPEKAERVVGRNGGSDAEDDGDGVRVILFAPHHSALTT